jgi:NSS family neurotransmitter:Na+ symporter
MVKYVTPIVLGFVIVTFLIQELKNPYEDYPMWALAVGGWGLTGLLIVLSVILSILKGKTPKAEVKS